MQEKTVIVVMGLPLSGKTSAGKKLSQLTGLHYVDIDDIAACCAPPQEENPYRSDEARARERRRMTVVYTIQHATVTANLSAGFSLIVAATYSRHSNQQFLLDAIKAGGGRLKLVWCEFDDTEEEVAWRVNERLARSEIGGCRSVSHYFDDKGRYEGTDLPHVKIDPSTLQDWSKVLEYVNS